MVELTEPKIIKLMVGEGNQYFDLHKWRIVIIEDDAQKYLQVEEEWYAPGHVWRRTHMDSDGRIPLKPDFERWLKESGIGECIATTLDFEPIIVENDLQIKRWDVLMFKDSMDERQFRRTYAVWKKRSWTF